MGPMQQECFMSLPDLILQRLDGTELPLSTLQGQVVLVVNVASRCGFTPSTPDWRRFIANWAHAGW